ncbi:abortive infection family protein [Sphingomonas kyeonggiensis]|uniref:Abortive infection protein-like C-terminal domain-containing protein n=1 Tax=Sphingomonas kyeonggiensis TaxID=1268553 RepID=A0A7W6JQ41_9SPHN|nr:abortive infection family protein [Sphingomonas kyeonggiensis]MBB4097450.1 hypothetical protein [Sphingomonas kyeonggiensis]
MDADVYRVVRGELIADAEVVQMLPRFLRTCQTTDDFWQHIKMEFSTYAERRAHIREVFAPLLEYLERAAAPGAEAITDALRNLQEGEVHRIWAKALARCASDPEGAVTAARTLLESVCMHILDGLAEGGTPLYTPGDDLPKLYRATAEQLNLAPSQHTEDVFKRLLGGCTTVVESIGAIRNRVGDAHGRGRRPVKIAPRHAHLAVNLAGAVALFLAETAEAKAPKQ